MFAYRWAGAEIKLPSCSLFRDAFLSCGGGKFNFECFFLPSAIDNKISVAWVDSGVVVERNMRNLKLHR